MASRSSRRSAAVAASAAISATVAHHPPPSPVRPSPQRRVRAARTLAKRVSYKEIPFDADLVQDEDDDQDDHAEEGKDEEEVAVILKNDEEDVQGDVEEAQDEGEEGEYRSTSAFSPPRPLLKQVPCTMSAPEPASDVPTPTPVEPYKRMRNRKGVFRSRVRQRPRASHSATPAALAAKRGEGEEVDGLTGTPDGVLPKRMTGEYLIRLLTYQSVSSFLSLTDTLHTNPQLTPRLPSHLNG